MAHTMLAGLGANNRRYTGSTYAARPAPSLLTEAGVEMSASAPPGPAVAELPRKVHMATSMRL